MKNIFDKNCPTRVIYEDVSKKWAPMVIILLMQQPLRFSELRRRTSGVSQKVLTQTLRTLERNGLVARNVNPSTVPITVTYSLTSLGESLAVPMDAIRVWTEQNQQTIFNAQKEYDKRLRSIK